MFEEPLTFAGQSASASAFREQLDLLRGINIISQSIDYSETRRRSLLIVERNVRYRQTNSFIKAIFEARSKGNQRANSVFIDTYIARLMKQFSEREQLGEH